MIEITRVLPEGEELSIGNLHGWFSRLRYGGADRRRVRVVRLAPDRAMLAVFRTFPDRDASVSDSELCKSVADFLAQEEGE